MLTPKTKQTNKKILRTAEFIVNNLVSDAVLL